MITRYGESFVGPDGFTFPILDFSALADGELEQVIHDDTVLIYGVDKDGDPEPLCIWGVGLVKAIADGVVGPQSVKAIGLALAFDNAEEVHALCEGIEAIKGFHEWPLPV